MDFNQVVKKEIMSLIHELGFHISDEFTGYVKIESPNFVAVFLHDRLEKTNSLIIGDGQSYSIQLDSEILQEIFEGEHNLQLSNYEEFAKSAVSFLQKNFTDLSRTNSEKWIKLKRYVENKSRAYTQKIIDAQKLTELEGLWLKQDFKGFVNCYLKIDSNALKASHRKKYLMAIRKLESELD